MGKQLKLTPEQIKALWDYLDKTYDDFHLQCVTYSPKADVLALADATYGTVHMIVASLFFNEGVVMANDLDAVMVYQGDNDEDYDGYDDQQRHDDEVADDLYYTFLGADDEMRFREDYE